MPSRWASCASVLLHRLRHAIDAGRGGPPSQPMSRACAFKVSANHGAASLKFHQPVRELPQIESDLLGVEPGRKVAHACDGQMPAEDDPVKAFENPVDFRAMLGDKRVHGVVPCCWYG